MSQSRTDWPTDKRGLNLNWTESQILRVLKWGGTTRTTPLNPSKIVLARFVILVEKVKAFFQLV